MPLFTVDKEKCDLCQVCVSASPVGLVGMTANTWPRLGQFLLLLRGQVMLASMAIGHPAFQYARIPSRKELRVVWK